MPIERAKAMSAEVSNGPVTEPAIGEWLERYRSHLLEREYMSGVERDKARIKATSEVFTPDFMVKHLVHRVGEDKVSDPEKRIIDPTCGDGQFLAYILYCRLKSEVPLLFALETLYGIEKEPDNHKMCQARLRCGHDDKNSDVFKIVKRNILRRDALRYDFSFGEKKSSADYQKQDDWLNGAKSQQ